MKKIKTDARLYYNARDLADILNRFGLDCQNEALVMERIWHNERPLLEERYRTDKRRLILETYYWKSYAHHKADIDAEFPAIREDSRAYGGSMERANLLNDCSDIDMFFKLARMQILYGGGNPYVRIKRSTLLSGYKHKRLSPLLLDRIQGCLEFYRLETYLRGGVPCQIKDIKSDTVLTLRVAQPPKKTPLPAKK